MNWKLPALLGVLDALMAAVYFDMHGAGEPLSYHAWKNMALLLGVLALAAGACTLTAGARFRVLLPAGAALAALGAIYCWFVRYPIGFVAIALLIALTAASTGAFELGAGRLLRRPFLSLAGAASFGFALAFLVLGFRWVRIQPGSRSDLLWLGAYFAFSAVPALAAAARLRISRAQTLP